MRRFTLAFFVILAGCWFITGSSDDFRMDALLGEAILNGGSPHLPATAYGGTADVIAFRTQIALMLSLPFGIFEGGQLFAVAALFVAATGAWLIHALNVSWWGSGLIVVWPFSEVDVHGKWTFLLAVLLILATRLEPKWAGLMLALAVGINLWPALIAVGWMVSERWRTAVWSGVWFVGLSLVMLPTSVSIGGTLSALSQDATYNPANLTLLRFAPWYVIPLGVVVFAVWAIRQEWMQVWRWGILVGLALSPVVWAAYLPVLVTPYAENSLSPGRKGEGVSVRSAREKGRRLDLDSDLPNPQNRSPVVRG